jgi:hypothetical protein
MVMEVTELLNKVIGLIEKDVQAIAHLSKHGDKLDHLVAQDLVRYSSALLDLSSSIDARSKEERGKLAKMSTDELMKYAKDIVDGKT